MQRIRGGGYAKTPSGGTGFGSAPPCPLPSAPSTATPITLLCLEGATLAVAGAIAGVVGGGLLAWQYTAFLPGIFAVALPTIAIPLAGLGELLGLALAGVATAIAVATARLRGLWPADVLRDI